VTPPNSAARTGALSSTSVCSKDKKLTTANSMDSILRAFSITKLEASRSRRLGSVKLSLIRSLADADHGTVGGGVHATPIG
jgi:hypothetical protein